MAQEAGDMHDIADRTTQLLWHTRSAHHRLSIAQSVTVSAHLATSISKQTTTSINTILSPIQALASSGHL